MPISYIFLLFLRIYLLLGGTSIEDVAAASPELIFKQPIDITVGITPVQSAYLATSLGFAPGSAVINQQNNGK